MRFDKATFAVFDAFNDEAGRTAHLNGSIAAALMANAAALLAVHSEIRQPVMLADKLPA
jgi:quinol monooxygenase YgiN